MGAAKQAQAHFDVLLESHGVMQRRGRRWGLKEGKNRMIYVRDKWGKNVRLSLSESGGTKTMASIVIQ